MKKCIKNYLAQLKENDKKGFSLVELIIVMAIMAILVGIVASQVIPYMEKSRQSKDQQQLSSIQTSIVSAIAQDANFDQSLNGAKTKGESAFKLSSLQSETSATIEQTFADLCGYGGQTAGAVETGYRGKMKSKAANDSAKTDGIYVTLYKSGTVKVWLGKSGGAATAKLEVESE